MARLFRDKVKFSLHVEFTQASILAGGVHAVSGFILCVQFSMNCICSAARFFTVSHQCPQGGCWSLGWQGCMPPALRNLLVLVTQTLQAVPAAGTYT